MMGKVAGKQKVGSKQTSWCRNFREWSGIKTVEQLFRMGQEQIKI